MVANQKVTGRSASIPWGIGIGVLVSVLLTVVGSAVVALLVSSETLPENGIGYCSIVILILSASIGSAVSYGLIKHRRLVVCMLHGLSYYLVLLGCTALFFGGQYQGMGVTALVVLAGCGTVGLLGLKGGKTTGIKIKKITSR